MTDYGKDRMPPELVLGLLQMADMHIARGSIFEAVDKIRIDRETWNTVSSSALMHMKRRYPSIDVVVGDVDEMTDTEKALLDAIALATMFGALVGAEQELKVTAVVTDDAGRTINTPKARLRHNDPRLRRNRRGR